MKAVYAALCLSLIGATVASDSNSNGGQNFNVEWFGWNGMNNNGWNGFNNNNNNNGWYGGMVGVPMVMAAPMPMIGGGPVGGYLLSKGRVDDPKHIYKTDV